MILLTLQNLGSAMADVVIDAMIAEAVRFESIQEMNLTTTLKNRASFAGDLQSISWMAMALGGICGSLFVDSKVSSGYLTSNGGSHSINGSDTSRSQNNISSKKSKSNTLMRKRSQKSAKQGPVTSSKFEVPEVQRSFAKKWLHSLKIATYSLFEAFRQPIILRPMTWFFLAHVTVPNLSTVMFYYQTETLKLEASFLGTARVVGWLGLMLGTVIYNRYLKKLKLRRILLFMPFLILSGQLCPPGIEGTLFALFMSINNLGSTVGNFVGAGLASILNISSGNFDNLLLGIVIQVLCTFIPVAFLFLIPKEATGISA
ncbi:hypothetical protein DH2020_033318 [Rehmannia glutinosa]|uniref:Uncharacterized protein n=1 Tax=Rehmannia glutinosa TaxID=99300 RepID=A0ABR0VFF2_REHGL